MKDTMLKFLVILSFAAAISACTPEQPSQQQTKIKSERSSTALTTEKPSIPQNTQSTQSTEQVKGIANDYGVSEERVNNVAGRAAELSGGNANKQDMLDALKAASGK